MAKVKKLTKKQTDLLNEIDRLAYDIQLEAESLDSQIDNLKKLVLKANKKLGIRFPANFTTNCLKISVNNIVDSTEDICTVIEDVYEKSFEKDVK
jgi:hypothetical protein